MREDLTDGHLVLFAKLCSCAQFERGIADIAIRTDGKAHRVLFQNFGFRDCSITIQTHCEYFQILLYLYVRIIINTSKLNRTSSASIHVDSRSS